MILNAFLLFKSFGIVLCHELKKSDLITQMKSNSILSLVAEPNLNGRKNSGVTDDERKKIMTTEVINDNNIVTPLINSEQEQKIQDDKISEDMINKHSIPPVGSKTANPKQMAARRGISGDLYSLKKNEMFEEIFGLENKSFIASPYVNPNGSGGTYPRIAEPDDRITDEVKRMESQLSETKRKEHEEDVFRGRGISNPSVPSNASNKLV